VNAWAGNRKPAAHRGEQTTSLAEWREYPSLPAFGGGSSRRLDIPDFCGAQTCPTDNSFKGLDRDSTRGEKKKKRGAGDGNGSAAKLARVHTGRFLPGLRPSFSIPGKKKKKKKKKRGGREER